MRSCVSARDVWAAPQEEELPAGTYHVVAEAHEEARAGRDWLGGARANQCQSVSISFNKCQSMSISAKFVPNQCQISVNQCATIGALSHLRAALCAAHSSAELWCSHCADVCVWRAQMVSEMNGGPLSESDACHARSQRPSRNLIPLCRRRRAARAPCWR